MECRSLDIKIIKASDLKDVNLMSKMDVYAVISISGDSKANKSKQKTPVDKDGGTNPKWNHSMKFTVNEEAAQQNRLTLKIKLVSDRSFGDKEIGKVRVPVKELLDSSVKGDGDEEKSEKHVTYSVMTPSGKAKGTVEFSYKFGEKYTATPTPPPMAAKKGDEPVMAYPQGYAGSSSAYPPPGGYPPAGVPATGYQYPPPGAYAPPPQGYGYPPAPGYGYGGYPPQQAGYGYGYPPVQKPQKPKKSGAGGMALGLGAGLLGGLLVGDMISDVGEMAAYDDGGFGDGFDF